MSEATQPVFAIEKIYVKDLSVEVPNAPEIYLEREAPAVEVNITTNGRQVQPGLFEVALTITLTAKLKEKTVFLVEATEAGLFQIRNVPEQDIAPLLGIACPNTLFPYLREVVSDTTLRAGFTPVVLAPMNFEALYQQQIQQLQQQQAAAKPS
jgi:preprotein translocase subunit SecB